MSNRRKSIHVIGRGGKGGGQEDEGGGGTTATRSIADRRKTIIGGGGAAGMAPPLPVPAAAAPAPPPPAAAAPPAPPPPAAAAPPAPIPQAEATKAQQQQQQQQQDPPAAARAGSIGSSPAVGKTPTKKRIELGTGSSYYFRHAPKTPVQKAIDATRKMNASMMNEDSEEDGTMDSLFAASLAAGRNSGYDGSLRGVESSFMSSDSSSADTSRRSSVSSSSSGIDLLNHTTNSDTTELTASNFVRMRATQRLSFPRKQQRQQQQQEEEEENLHPAATNEKSFDAGTGSASAGVDEQGKNNVADPPVAGTEEGEEEGRAAPSRKPLAVNHQQRMSLPPPATRPLLPQPGGSTTVGASSSQPLHSSTAATTTTIASVAQRRESWHGSSSTSKPSSSSIQGSTPAAAAAASTGTPMSTQGMKKLATSLREKKRQRGAATGGRLSTGSNGNNNTSATMLSLNLSSLLPKPPSPAPPPQQQQPEESAVAGEAEQPAASSSPPSSHVLGSKSASSMSNLFPPSGGDANINNNISSSYKDNVTLSASMSLPELSPIQMSTSEGRGKPVPSGKEGGSNNHRDGAGGASNSDADERRSSSPTGKDLDGSKRALDDIFSSATKADDGDEEDRNDTEEGTADPLSLSFLNDSKDDDESGKEREAPGDQSSMETSQDIAPVAESNQSKGKGEAPGDRSSMNTSEDVSQVVESNRSSDAGEGAKDPFSLSFLDDSKDDHNNDEREAPGDQSMNASKDFSAAASEENFTNAASSRNISSVSTFSSISSATGLSKISKHTSSSIASKNNPSRPLPEAIAFQTESISPLNAKATSPFRYDRRPEEANQSLTPSKLKKSPRRLLPPPVDSPARNTRSAEKQRLEQEQREGVGLEGTGAEESTAAVAAAAANDEVETSNELESVHQNLFSSPSRNNQPTNVPVDSPARRTRSAEKRRQQQEDGEQQLNKGTEQGSVSKSPSRRGSSPRRRPADINSSVDSPARRTRSAEKRRLEQESNLNPSEQGGNSGSPSREGTSPRRRPSDINGSVDSPARHTRSAEKRRLEQESDPDSSQLGDSGVNLSSGDKADSKRKRDNDDAVNNLSKAMKAAEEDMDLDESVTVHSQKRHKSSASLVSSALRKPGSSKKAKTVAFGSPEIQTFNKRSPSMSVTPGAKGRRWADTDEDVTVDLEPDMATLLEDADTSLGVPGDELRASKQDAGSTPFATKKPSPVDAREASAYSLELLAEEDSESPKYGQDSSRGPLQAIPSCDSQMSIDSSSEDGAETDPEHTEEMEADIETLLRSEEAASSSTKKSRRSSGGADEEETVEMDIDMETLLRSEEEGKKSPALSKRGSVSPKSQQGQGQQQQEEDKTVELSMDLNHYLEGADQESLSEQPSLNISRRRRSSISSSRFSLAPGGRLSLSDCSGSSEQETRESSMLEQTQLSVHSGTSIDDPFEDASTEEAVFDLKNREIVNACGLAKASLDDKSDILYALSETITEPSVSTLLDCIGSVCNSLLDGVDESLNLDDVFETSEGHHEAFLVLQEAVRSGSNPVLQREVRKLVGAVRYSEEKELLSWLVSVAETLNERICGEAEEIIEQLNETELILKKVDAQYQKLSKLETKTARKARRRSLLRRKTNATKLEEDIANLEAKLAKAQSDLEATAKEHSIACELVSTISQLKALTEDVSAAKSKAASSERNYAILSGVGKLRPGLLHENELRFTFVGPCPAACIELAFNVDRGGEVTCRATNQPKLLSKEGRGKIPKSISSFFESRVSLLCSLASSERIDSALHIGSSLRRIEWEMCRIEQTGSELAMIQRRYRGQLIFGSTSDSNPIFLEVEFTGTGKAELVATFELSPAYPFSPVNVELDVLEGEVDMEGIRKVLITNAKPGYGYLSRTCDMIAAILR